MMTQPSSEQRHAEYNRRLNELEAQVADLSRALRRTVEQATDLSSRVSRLESGLGGDK